MTDLYNPFTGEVSKAVSPMYGAKDAFANQPTRKVASLLPTGKHVSHANDLHVTRHGRRKNVGRYGETKLERFGKKDRSDENRVRNYARRGGVGGLLIGGTAGGLGGHLVGQAMAQDGYELSRGARAGMTGIGALHGGVRLGAIGALGGAATGAVVGPYKKKVKKNFTDLGSQPGMVNPGVVTSSWSHGTPNQNFAAASGRRGRKIA